MLLLFLTNNVIYDGVIFLLLAQNQNVGSYIKIWEEMSSQSESEWLKVKPAPTQQYNILFK